MAHLIAAVETFNINFGLVGMVPFFR